MKTKSIKIYHANPGGYVHHIIKKKNLLVLLILISINTYGWVLTLQVLSLNYLKIRLSISPSLRQRINHLWVKISHCAHVFIFRFEKWKYFQLLINIFKTLNQCFRALKTHSGENNKVFMFRSAISLCSDLQLFLLCCINTIL